MSGQYTNLVLSLVREERDFQDSKWGPIHRRLHADQRWIAVLADELGEAASEVLDGSPGRLIDELIQLAAVAVSHVETIMEREGIRPGGSSSTASDQAAANTKDMRDPEVGY